MCIQETYEIIDKHLESYNNNDSNIIDIIIDYVKFECNDCNEKIIEYNFCDLEENIWDYENYYVNMYCNDCIINYKCENEKGKCCNDCIRENGGFICLECEEINSIGIFGNNEISSCCNNCGDFLTKCKKCGYKENGDWVNIEEINNEENSYCNNCILKEIENKEEEVIDIRKMTDKLYKVKKQITIKFKDNNNLLFFIEDKKMTKKELVYEGILSEFF